MQRTSPPFRADHVGSLLRPPVVKEARTKRERGEITADALRAIEDKEIDQLFDRLAATLDQTHAELKRRGVK